MSHEIDEGFRASVGRLLADSCALRSSVLLAHERAADDLTALRLIREMTNADLLLLRVGTEEGVHLDEIGAARDQWLHQIVLREYRRRERRLDVAPGFAA